MWENPNHYRYEGKKHLFLGIDKHNNEVGLRTERHALTIAGAGAGKGACVIIPNLLRWSDNALVIDPKGEAAEATAEYREKNFGQKSHVLDPFLTANVPDHLRASYNFLADLNEGSMTIKEDIEAISDGIIKRDNPESSHWDDGAQAIISGLIAYLILTAPEDKKNLIELRQIMRNMDDLDSVIEEMKSLEGCAGLCQSGASAFYAKEGGYFASNAEKNTRWLDSEGMKNSLQSSTFSLSDLKNKDSTVYLILPANYLGQHGRFLRLFVRGAIEEMARRTPDGKLRDKQCLFILDEFFSLGYIDEISKAAGLMRGYGLQLWPILQDLGQLLKLYGREGAETFFGNADLHQFFGNTDQMTLEHISTRLGLKNVDETSEPPKASFFQSNAFDSMYQNEMNEYQREMSTVGKPRYAPEQVATLVQRKNDVVADGIINLIHGSNALFVNPAPYFRTPNNPKTNQNINISMYLTGYIILSGMCFSIGAYLLGASNMNIMWSGLGGCGCALYGIFTELAEKDTP